MPNRPSDKYCYCPERYVDINTKILKEFAKEVIKEICINPDGVELPNPFGKIYVVGVKNQNKPLNHNATKKYGIKIYHENVHTDGYVFKAAQRSRRKAYKFNFFYGFKGYKPIKRAIKETIDGGKWQHWGQYSSIKDIK